jgi:O-antigen/teichoic acid export membrane protein
LLTICALVAIPFLVTSPIPIAMILFIALSDIVLTPTNSLCAFCFQAIGRPMWNAWMNVVFSAVRLAAALVWVYFIPDHTALSWSYWYCGSAALVAALSLSQVLQKLGRPVWRVDWSEWKEGFHFSILFASLSVFREIDRPVIAAVSSLSTVGVYAAAFRVADAAVMPVRAVMYSTFGHFFRVGAGGPREAMKFALKILPVTVGIGVVAGLLIAAVAPFAPILLGKSYAGTSQALLILAPLPTLYAAFYLAADVLVGSDRTWMRNLIQLVAPVVDVALCLVLVPTYGASGAAVAAIVGHASAVVMAWGTVLFLARGSQPGSA